MTDSKDIVVLYHGNCPDGFTSAWQAWRFLGDSADYIAVNYGEPMPTGLEDKNVYILDFCYSVDETLDLIGKVRALTVLDHHKTAARAMAELTALEYPKHVQFVFDMDRSGAGITRDHFHKDTALADCWIVDYVQDRDLWRFELPDSKLVNAYLHTLDFTFTAFESVDNSLTAKEAAKLGEGAEQFKSMYVDRLMKQAIRVTFAGYQNIPMVNAPYVGISELCSTLAQGETFAVGWCQRADGKISFSLRSVGAFDVSEVAKQYGGGGHRNAAGFTIDCPVHHHFSMVT